MIGTSPVAPSVSRISKVLVNFFYPCSAGSTAMPSFLTSSFVSLFYVFLCSYSTIEHQGVCVSFENLRALHSWVVGNESRSVARKMITKPSYRSKLQTTHRSRFCLEVRYRQTYKRLTRCRGRTLDVRFVKQNLWHCATQCMLASPRSSELVPVVR